MTLKTKPFKFAEFVETEDDIRLYLSIFLEEDGEDGFNSALEHLAREKGIDRAWAIALWKEGKETVNNQQLTVN